MQPVGPLCRLSSLHWLLPLQLPMWRPLLPQLRPLWLLPRWRALFRWQRWLLRWLHWRPMSLQSLWWLLRLPLPELRLVLSQLLSVVLVLQVYPKRLLL
jgi:hypothetical protein